MAVPDAVRLLADQLEVYLAVFYPHMPAIAREAIVGRYALRPLKGRLPVVAGIVTSNHARGVFEHVLQLLVAQTHWFKALEPRPKLAVSATPKTTSHGVNL